MSAEIPAANRAPASQCGPIASYLGAVKSLPFGARFEQIQVTRDPRGVSSEQRVTGVIYRDSAGRARGEQVHGDGMNQEGFELIIITDFAARTATALDVAAKIATIFTDMGPPPGEEVPLIGWGFRGAWSLERPAVEKVIEGISCRRAKRVGWPLGSALKSEEGGELWISEELKHSVLEHVTDAGGERTWRLYDIRRVEPPSSLFVVPSGYTEVVRSKFS